MKSMICVLFAAVAILDNIRTGAPLAGMLLCAAGTAAVLFAAVEYLSRTGSAAAEMMGRMTFIISIVSLTVMPWPTIEKIFVAVLLMAVSSFAVYFVEKNIEEKKK